MREQERAEEYLPHLVSGNPNPVSMLLELKRERNKRLHVTAAADSNDGNALALHAMELRQLLEVTSKTRCGTR